MICLMVRCILNNVVLTKHDSPTLVYRGAGGVYESTGCTTRESGCSIVISSNPGATIVRADAVTVSSIMQHLSSTRSSAIDTRPALPARPTPAFDPLKRAQKKKPPPAIPPDVFGGQGVPPELQSLLAELTAGLLLTWCTTLTTHKHSCPRRCAAIYKRP